MNKEDLYFCDWESRVFGAGYGSGERPIMEALKTFFNLLENERNYDHEVLEKELGKTVTWLLINALDKGNVIEWGTSARYGWLTSCGELLRRYVKNKTTEQLYEVLMSDHEPICMCDGEIKDHEDCGKNHFVFEKVADKLV